MKILDIAFKDLTRSFRSAFAVGTMVVAPLMLIGLIYFAFGGASSGTSDLPAVKVGVVCSDKLPADVLLDHPILELDNVLLTPHIGGATYDTEVTHTRMIARDLAALLSGERPIHIVNPEVLDK